LSLSGLNSVDSSRATSVMNFSLPRPGGSSISNGLGTLSFGASTPSQPSATMHNQ
jgi:hypothetical protein